MSDQIETTPLKDESESSFRNHFDHIGSCIFASLPWLLALICFLAPFIFIRQAYDFANLPQLIFIQLAVFFVATVAFIAALLKSRLTIRLGQLQLSFALFAFVLWASIAYCYGHNQWEGTYILIHWWTCLLVFFIVLNCIRNNEDCHRLMGSVAIAAGVTALIGILQHLAGLDIIPQAYPPAGVLANKNMAAHFMVLSFPIASAMFINTRYSLKAMFWGIIITLILVFVFYTKTRSAWLAISVQLGLLSALILIEKLKRRSVFMPGFKYLALLVAVIVLSLFIIIEPNEKTRNIDAQNVNIVMVSERNADEIIFQKSPYTSINIRLAIWRNTVEMIKDKPFLGFGLGNHKVFYPAYKNLFDDQTFSKTTQLQHVHNDLLQIFSEMGIPGVLLALCLVVVFFKQVYRLYKDPEIPVKVEVMAIGVSVVGILIVSGFSFPFQRTIPPFVFVVFLGIIAFWTSESKSDYKITISSKCLIVAGLILFLSLFYLALERNSKVIDAEKLFPLIASLEKNSQWEDLILVAEKAYSLNPQRVHFLAYAGRGLIEMDRYQEGAQFLEKVANVYPYQVNTLINLGLANYMLGNMDKAHNIYDRLLMIDPQNPETSYYIGNILIKKGYPSEGLIHLRKAVELEPNDPFFQFDLGLVEYKIQNFKQAAKAFRITTVLEPEWVLARKNLGIIYALHINRPLEAIEELKKVLEVNPEDSDAEQIKDLIKQISP